MLVRPVEKCPSLLSRNEVDGGGGVNDSGFAEGGRSLDFIPQDWTPG